MSGLYPALLAAQAEMPKLQRTKINPAFRSRYVPLEQLHAEVLPILNEHGLVWVTAPIHAEGPSLRYRLIHAESGDTIEGTMPLMLDKQNPQGQGSAITYARRYALMAVLGLVADDDDDGNAASGNRRPSGARENRRQGKRSPAPSEAVSVTDSGPSDAITTETLEALRKEYDALGKPKAKLTAIAKELGASGSPDKWSEDAGCWAIVKLRELSKSQGTAS